MNFQSENRVKLLLHTENQALEQFFEQNLQLDMATMRLAHIKLPYLGIFNSTLNYET